MVCMKIIITGKGEQKADKCTESLLLIIEFRCDDQNLNVSCYILHVNLGA